jgi:hypothetical protein
MRSCGEHIQPSYRFRIESDAKLDEGNVAFKQSIADRIGK